MKKSYVYIISISISDSGPLAVKIGRTESPSGRAHTLQRDGCGALFPFDYQIIKVVSLGHADSWKLESCLHQIFIDYRIKGEWFEPTIIDKIDDAIKQAKQARYYRGIFK